VEAFLSPGFWFDQIAAAVKAWAIIILLFPTILILLCLGVLAGFRIARAKSAKEVRSLRAHSEAVESRLEVARELNSGEAETIAKIRTEVDELRQLIEAKTEARVVEPRIQEVAASTAALAMTNRVTDHVLTAEELAIKGFENRRRLKLARSRRH
jgi:septal ring factor EnvC (AmiA/AmiB activator)